jgi:hypothetical protein
MKGENGMQKLIQRFLLVAAIMASLCGSVWAGQAEDDWYVALRLGYQPYTVEASGTVVNRDFSAKADLSDIMDKTDTTLAGGELEVGKGPWFAVLPVFWQKSRIEDGSGNDFTFKEFGINPMLGYTVYRQGMGGDSALAIDLMAGIYYVKVSSDLDIPSAKISRSEDIDFVDGMVGMRLRYAFTKNWGVNLLGEVGGGGSRLQYVAAANLSYSFTDWLAMSVGYKYWYFKYVDSDKPLNELEQKLYGPVIGVQFKF